MTASVPLAKERIKIEIRKNKEKLRTDQRKLQKIRRESGEHVPDHEGIQGRDGLDFIVQELVTKEKQLQRIEEDIGQL